MLQQEGLNVKKLLFTLSRSIKVNARSMSLSYLSTKGVPHHIVSLE